MRKPEKLRKVFQKTDFKNGFLKRSRKKLYKKKQLTKTAYLSIHFRTIYTPGRGFVLF